VDAASSSRLVNVFGIVRGRDSTTLAGAPLPRPGRGTAAPAEYHARQASPQWTV